MEEYRPTITLDFDGVVHKYTSPWTTADEISDGPVDGALEFIFDALDSGYDIAIFSSRSHQPRGVEAMRGWLRKHVSLIMPNKIDDLIHVQFPQDKPASVVSIDDRGVTFDGKFPDLRLISHFKPWNRRSPEDPFVMVKSKATGRVGLVQVVNLNDHLLVDGDRVIDALPRHPKIVQSAAIFLRAKLKELSVFDVLKEWIEADPEEWMWTQAPAGWHFYGGMRVRNALREAGYGEERLGIMNLDDVYLDIVKMAVDGHK